MEIPDRSSRCLIAALMLLWPAGQASLRASPARSGSPPEQAPRVENPRIETRTQEGTPDWSPLASGKTHNPIPEAKRLLPGLARGEAKDLEEVVRTSYRLTSAYARNEGHAITFELSDFRTVYTPEALRLKYGEIVTLDVPDRIAITGVSRNHTVQDREGGVLSGQHRRGFAAKWEPNPPVPDQALWKKRSMSEIIEMGRELQPELARLRAVTSYRVVVTFEGIRRSYRAAFVWMGGVATPAIERFECWEPVANRVGLVLLEETQPESGRENPSEEPKGLSEN